MGVTGRPHGIPLPHLGRAPVDLLAHQGHTWGVHLVQRRGPFSILRAPGGLCVLADCRCAWRSDRQSTLLEWETVDPKCLELKLHYNTKKIRYQKEVCVCVCPTHSSLLQKSAMFERAIQRRYVSGRLLCLTCLTIAYLPINSRRFELHV